MLEFLWGYFIGLLAPSRRDQEEYCREFWEELAEGSTHIPPFKGHFENRGSWVNEQWEWVEPKYKPRFVNVLKEKETFIINMSFDKKKEAIEYEECLDQREAELMAECLASFYSVEGKIIIRTDGELCSINVFRTEDGIHLNLCKDKKDCWERINCLDVEEGEFFLRQMRQYYTKYSLVTVNNEFANRRY